jgi:hypothetical protein
MTENRHSRRTFRRGHGRPAVVRLPSLQQFALMLVAFVALAIQTLVVQTHVHRDIGRSSHISTTFASTGEVAAFAGVSIDTQSNGPRDPFPGNDDPNCALCQGVAHSGQFVHSAAVLAYIPVWVTVHFIVRKDLLPQRVAASHSWQGRAPPQD